MSETVQRHSNARLLVWAFAWTVVAYAVMAALGNVVTVQSAADAAAFGQAAAEAGNRVRLALLVDTIAFLPGYALTVAAWCRWRAQRWPSEPQPDAEAARGQPTRRVATLRRLYWAGPRLIVLTAGLDLIENLLVYLGLGTVGLGHSDAATAVSPPDALITALRWASGCKWLAAAAALAAVAVAGALELATRRTVRQSSAD